MNLNDPQKFYTDQPNPAGMDSCLGIRIETALVEDIQLGYELLQRKLSGLGLTQYVQIEHIAEKNRNTVALSLSPEWARRWAADHDTRHLCRHLNLDTRANSDDLEREILLAMLVSPVPFRFPNYQELASALKIRRNIVLNARMTALSFSTDAAERPPEYWRYDEDTGFTILPGKSLIGALQKATQPDESGKRYSFSCYRATEYVILLSIAQELSQCNPELYLNLQSQWEKKAIMSGRFHEVFLQEYGSMEEPLPAGFYVPGDRLWFRNPDEPSSDVTGYEGSWVFYLGNGQFTNFWAPETPYNLTTKCVEIYHWRNATRKDGAGELQMDEDRVEELVRASLRDQQEVERILEMMLRLREPKGVYRNGGCIDTSREFPRLVCPGSSDMALA